MTSVCPRCRQAMQLPEPLPAGFLTCPHCGEAFVIASEPAVPSRSGDPRADELDGTRIRQLSKMRRAGYRSRSYAIIAGIVLAVAVLQLIYKAWREWNDWTYHIGPIAYLVLACGAAYGAAHFLRRAMTIHRELRPLESPPPAAAPDFTPLQDGRQIADRLNELR